MKEVWEVDKSQQVIYPQDLIDNPGKFGGMGPAIKNNIKRGIVNIPLKYGCVYMGIPVSQSDAERIIQDSGVDIYSEGSWCSTDSVRVMFLNSNQKIDILTRFVK